MGMISNGERRKVAKELREFVGARSFASLKRLGHTTIKSNELLATLFGFEYYKNPFEAIEEIDSADVLKLADLIDRPTCNNVSTLGNPDEFECSECGNGLNIGDQLSGWQPINYCPFCGAEVIE